MCLADCILTIIVSFVGHTQYICGYVSSRLYFPHVTTLIHTFLVNVNIYTKLFWGPSGRCSGHAGVSRFPPFAFLTAHHLGLAPASESFYLSSHVH
ncbi:hypothetical protein BC827DRAFT_409359 [Russula dissimulans]|nr:hypothetical protein BC827DRAFT_409359 [Russula dissimulans]